MTQIIKVTTTGDKSLNKLLLRQTPGSTGRWGDNVFFINEEINYCDWWFVCHSTALKQPETTICDPRHVVFVSMEPREFRDPKFYRQFSKVIACDDQLKHPSILPLNAITWWAGIEVEFNNGHKFNPEPNYDYDSLSGLAIPEKQDRISIITSDNDAMPGHRKRINFIEHLKASRIAEKIDVFGGGHNPIPDKIDAILPYKYHIALENSRIESYWTEKIGDSFLGYAMPFYHGCPNIKDFFPQDSFVEINIEDPPTSIKKISDALEKDYYSRSFSHIDAARELIMNKYNIFNSMSEFASEQAFFGAKKKITLKPAHFYNSSCFSVPSKFIAKLNRRVKSILLDRD